VGKIFDALEKFTMETGPTRSDKVRNSDYEVLMQFDASTGKIDMADPEVLKDARGVKRLVTYRLINDDGTLTPAGRAKFEEMQRKKEEPELPKASMSDRVEKPTPSDTLARQPEGMSDSDWTLLMNYDRNTGNLLKYDPETGQLDDDFRNALQDPAAFQRLIDNQMILPGGWLTDKAKQQCARMEEESGKKQTSESAKGRNVSEDVESRGTPEPPEALSQADINILLQHDPATRKLDPQHPSILKDPAIWKRLLDNKMIEANGKLIPQALVRCRALMRLNKDFKAKSSLSEKAKPSSGEKSQSVVGESKARKIPGEADEQKVKINRSEDEEKEAKHKEGKPLEIIHDLTTVSKPEAAPQKPAKTSPQRKFTRVSTPAKYARREIEKDLVTLMNPQSFEAEQFKILRTNLLFAESGKMPRSVMVTSAMSGEGKSFVAANLAVSVARHVNWNVLLIDCDLRRPNIHRQFGFQNFAGLSNYLAEGTDLEPLLLKTGIENLTILPAGKTPDNPSELLSSKRMAALLEEAASRYKDRLIIIDSPPPTMTAESGALARYVDGILLVVKYGSTPKDSAKELIGKLGRKKILGAVINNFDIGSSRYRKKYYGAGYYSQ
jgi:exopolysaccharide/PEP-CTERM locus tyrosine autokinase